MRWLWKRLVGWLTRPPRLRCRRSLWRAGVTELARRTGGERHESGAFLLGRAHPKGGDEILDFVFYDDLDPHAYLTGAVVIRQTVMPRLWAICRERGYGVVADVHVHPGGYGQSDSDAESPVMPRAGHIALILPRFARGNPEPGSIGLYEFLGSGRWRDHSAAGSGFLRLEGAP
jgi:hypothetical protein